jgi:hypothetical protein
LRKNTKDYKKSSSLRNEWLVCSSFPACYPDNKPATTPALFAVRWRVKDLNFTEFSRIQTFFFEVTKTEMNCRAAFRNSQNDLALNKNDISI